MIFRYISILAIMVLAPACDTSEKLEYRPDDSPNRVSIAYLKSLYRSQPVRIAEDLSIYGFVTANDDNGNLYKAICLADSTGGIMLRLDAERLYRRFWTGAAVTVRCNGLWIGSYGGMLELGTAPTSGYEVDPIGEDEITVFVTADTAAQIEIIPHTILISSCAPDLAGTQVRFDGVQFIAEEIGSGWCDLGFDEESGEEVRVASTRHLVDRTGDTLAVYTSPMADFVELPLPEGSGSIEGLLTFFNRSYQLRITDFRRCDMNGPRF